MMNKHVDSVQDPIPDYLNDTYWWAYLTPEAIRFFDRPWMTNLILWGNYARLGRAVINELRSHVKCQVVQIGSVYGSLTKNIAAALKSGSRYTVVDVAQIQLDNLKSKMGANAMMHYLQCDATQLKLPSASSDLTLLFFLLHEVPAPQKTWALSEAWRITKPKGKLVVVDYHQPGLLNPLRYLMQPLLKKLEPFALELWRKPVQSWMPSDTQNARVEKTTYFGGLYQKVTFYKK